MEKELQVGLADRSLSALLFLIPQAARTMREVLRVAQSSEGPTPEESALFAQQEALLQKYYKAIAAMSRDGWDFADECLANLSTECEVLRTKLDGDRNDRNSQNFLNKLAESLRKLGHASGLPEGEDDDDEQR